MSRWMTITTRVAVVVAVALAFGAGAAATASTDEISDKLKLRLRLPVEKRISELLELKNDSGERNVRANFFDNINYFSFNFCDHCWNIFWIRITSKL